MVWLVAEALHVEMPIFGTSFSKLLIAPVHDLDIPPFTVNGPI
jgi:hypothetical protein